MIVPKRKVYVETSVVSYLAARPARDLQRRAHQQITRDWWSSRSRFEMFVSELVLVEASRGDRAAADERLAALMGLTILPMHPEVGPLASRLLSASALPHKATIDAAHVALATVHEMDYLVTWNCRHIANAMRRGDIERTCAAAGFRAPVMCTPEQLPETEDEN